MLGLGLGISTGYRYLTHSASTLALYAVGGFIPSLVASMENEFYNIAGTTTTFDSALTHTRVSTATMIDSDGLLKWAPHNLLTYSEQFDNVAWSKYGVEVEEYTQSKPNNIKTAYTLTSDGSGTGYVNQFGVGIAGVQHTASFWMKRRAGTGSIYLYDANGANPYTIPLTNEWQKFSYSSVPSTTTTRVYFRIIESGDSVDIAGAHLYRSDLGGMVNNPDRGDSYVPTTTAAVYLPRRGHHVWNGSAWVNEGLLLESEARTNLVEYSDFSFSWVLSGATLIDNSITSPDGTTSAASVTSISGTSYGINNGSVTVTGANHTASAFFKANGFNYAKLTWLSAANATDFAVFNLSTGEISGGTYASALIEPFGNGWYRCSITSTLAATSSAGFYAWMSDGTLSRGSGVSGDGTSGIYIYGAQLEAGSTPSSYIPTSGATATRAAETLTVAAADLPWPTPRFTGVVPLEDDFSTYADTAAMKAAGWVSTASSGTGDISLVSGAMQLDCDGTGNRARGYQTLITVVGETYVVEYSSTLNHHFRVGTTVNGAQNLSLLNQPTGSNTFAHTFVATATTTYVTWEAFNPTGSEPQIDNISVREIDPLSVSIQMDGRMTYADEDTLVNVRFLQWDAAATGTYITSFLNTSGSGVNQVRFYQDNLGTLDTVSGPTSSYSPGVLQPYNIASRHGSTFINGAVDGTALTENTTPTALPGLSATNLQLAYDYMGTIRTFRMWNKDLTDEGIEEATLPSLEPSLSLVFDSSEGSFIVEDWTE